jgi:hypothetical protein
MSVVAEAYVVDADSNVIMAEAVAVVEDNACKGSKATGFKRILTISVYRCSTSGRECDHSGCWWTSCPDLPSATGVGNTSSTASRARTSAARKQ